MLKRLKNGLVLTAVSLTLASCAGTESSDEAVRMPSEVPFDDQLLQPADRPSWANSNLTSLECQQHGGKIVGDIGDGAIHRPDYRCDSGAAPMGVVIFATDQPAPVEGAVCCP